MTSHGSSFSTVRISPTIHPQRSVLIPSELLLLVASNLESDTDLVRATHVSHHWRITLRSHLSLWSHLDFEDTGRTLAFLEKSPLHVTLVRDSRVSPLVEPLRQHATRITTLILSIVHPRRCCCHNPCHPCEGLKSSTQTNHRPMDHIHCLSLL